MSFGVSHSFLDRVRRSCFVDTANYRYICRPNSVNVDVVYRLPLIYLETVHGLFDSSDSYWEPVARYYSGHCGLDSVWVYEECE